MGLCSSKTVLGAGLLFLIYDEPLRDQTHRYSLTTLELFELLIASPITTPQSNLSSDMMPITIGLILYRLTGEEL